MPDDMDDMPGSSPGETLSTEVETAVGSAANETADTSAPEAAAKGTQGISDVEPPDEPNAESAVDFLTGKKPDKKPEQKVDKPVEKKAAEPAKEEAKPEDKGEDPFGSDFTEKDRKLTGRKAEKRIRELHSKWKDAETRWEKDPVVNQGKAFGEVLDQFNLRGELKDLGDDGDKSVAGAIRFNASVNRIFAGRPRAEDKQVVAGVLDAMDGLRESMGMKKATAIDDTVVNDLETALKEYDLTKAMNIIEKLKAKPAPQEQRQAPPVPQQVQPEQTPQADIGTRLEQDYQSDRLANELTKDGVQNHAEYVKEKLWPSVVNKLQTKYPNYNPVAVYSRLSPAAQHDLHMDAHREVQKAIQASKPAVKPVPRTPTPISGTGTRKAAGAQPESGLKAAMQYLTG